MPYYQHNYETGTAEQYSHSIQIYNATVEPNTLNPNYYQNSNSFPTISTQYPDHYNNQDYLNSISYPPPPQQVFNNAPMIFNGCPNFYYPHQQYYQQPYHSSFGNAIGMRNNANQSEESSAVRNDNRVFPTFPSLVSVPSSISHGAGAPQLAYIMSDQDQRSSSAPMSTAPLGLPDPRQQQHYDDATPNNDVTLQDMRSLFHLTIEQAADQLGVNMATFTKVCRRHKIIVWPHRQIQGLQSRLQNLENLLSKLRDPNRNSISNHDKIREAYMNEISSLKLHIENIKDQAVSAALMSSKVSRHCDDTTGKSDGASVRSYPPSSTTRSTSASFLNSAVSSTQNSSLNTVKKKRKRRCDTTYDHRTGWVANCSNCGKVGKYRHPSAGRGFQHTSGGKYCGYYLINPRREGQRDDTTCEQKST